ncbi:lytic transglycosylase [Candidatus Epulonipiscium fishelsonii]|uniref:Lytic transglycosylase n=1 Tax=Candidatus Epulonipiscium fishelsonii TaxID=77094 RepID=A0ACC8XC05_9FIRM|nr:lytic transglycosylase [Epulopiscium sp. SCG-B11WGA-EpuloA1]ONI43570.1 lytic transglycosylase [Epulopiscium sp. SCG-B05WGA-EpuloA1]ONI47046.1 lytic transglycosylase [Epulopiscium sp. SCG-C06WGA-EpuloA1]
MKKYLMSTIIFVVLGIVIAFKIYPTPYREWVDYISNYYEVDPLLVYAIIQTESGFDKNAISRSGAKGLMQIMDRTGQWGAEHCGYEYFTPKMLFEPDKNIHIGTWYISRLIKQYGGNLDTALIAYNAGSGNVAKWRANTLYSKDGKTIDYIPFKETKEYVKKVKFHYKIYKLLYVE